QISEKQFSQTIMEAARKAGFTRG
ncbi:hypothetical protein ACTFYT_21815, partial [Klebsiella pneumoniae]